MNFRSNGRYGQVHIVYIHGSEEGEGEEEEGKKRKRRRRGKCSVKGM